MVPDTARPSAQSMESSPSWQPYVAHLALIAVVYGMLLAVVYLAFRSTSRPKKTATRPAAAPAAADSSTESLPPPDSLDLGAPEFALDGAEGEDQEIDGQAAAGGPAYGASSGGAYGASSGGAYGASSGGAYGASSGGAYGASSGAAYGAGMAAFPKAPASTLDRLERHLDAALAMPSTRAPKPRELLQWRAGGSQEAPSATKTGQDMLLRNQQLEDELEAMRRAELVRREQERKLAQAQRQAAAAAPSMHGGPSRPSARPAPETHVISAPLDAVYGGGETGQGAPAPNLALSAEERIMAKHVRGGDF
jgi:hypothetical protein